MSTHLVVPDPHAQPDVPNDRFTWLGKLAVDEQPDVIVCLGDFATMDSLSSYDKGKKSFEGKRFLLDCASARDALAKINAPIDEHNAKRRKYKEKLYLPRKIMLGGNHDHGRIHKTIELSPELEGLVDLAELGYEEHGWEYVPYTVPIEVDGVYYCHHFPNGNSKYPISGLYHGRKLILANHASSTVGHSHLLDVYTDVGADGRRIWGISGGCFTPDTPAYAGESAKYWWRGVILKRNVVKGDYDPEFISLKTLEVLYGS